jgi:E3 ubiquitin-protein ligase HERC2
MEQNGSKTLWSWGDNSYGKLGRISDAGSSLGIPGKINSDVDFVKVFCGAQFSIALSDNNKIYSWGKGEYFRLGHGNEQNYNLPKLVENLSKEKITDVAVGTLHVLVATKNGDIYSWGDNDEGQTGQGKFEVLSLKRWLSN